MPGIKHLIECHCQLAIFKNSEKNIYHKFPVYSILDENGKVVEKFRKCNNCEALHKIYDIGKSEIFSGKDQTNVTLTKEDISLEFHESLKKVLIDHDCDISSYFHAKHIIEEKRWGEIIVLKRDIIKESTSIKYLEVNNKNSFSIKFETIEDIIVGKNNGKQSRTISK